MKMKISFELIDQVLFDDDIAIDQFVGQFLNLFLKDSLLLCHKQLISD
jgi:hypothetical protein